MQTSSVVKVRSLEFSDIKPALTSGVSMNFMDRDSGEYTYIAEAPNDPKLNIDLLGDWVGLRVLNNTGGAIVLRMDLYVGDTPVARLDERTIADGEDYGWSPSFFAAGNIRDGGITTRLVLKSDSAGGYVRISVVVVDA